MRRILGVLMVLVMMAGAAVAAEGKPDKQFKEWEKRFEQIEERVGSEVIGTVEVRDLRAEIDTAILEATAIRDGNAKRRVETKALLDALGPQQEGDAAATETAEVKAKRKQLTEELTAYEGMEKQASLVLARASQVMEKVNGLSGQRLREALLAKGPSPLATQTWQVALPEFLTLATDSFVDFTLSVFPVTDGAAPADGGEGANANESGVKAAEQSAEGEAAVSEPSEDKAWPVLNALIKSVVAAGLAWFIRKWLLSRYGRHAVPEGERPSYARRLSAGLIVGVSRGLIPVLFIVAVRTFLFENGVVDGIAATVTNALTVSLALYFAGHALINAILSPKYQQWSILDLDPSSSKALARNLKAALATYLIFDGIWKSIHWATPSLELQSAYAFVFAMSLFPLLFALTRGKLWRDRCDECGDGPDDEDGGIGLMLRPAAAIAMLSLPVAAALGYPNLTFHLLSAATLTGIIASGLWLARTLVRELIAGAFAGETKAASTVRGFMDMDESGGKRMAFWVGMALDFVLLPIFVLAVVPLWGPSVDETVTFAKSAVKGFQIGSYTFSPVDVMVGIGIFAVVVVITKMVQRGLSKHLLPNMTRDRGLRDALKSGVGYAGFGFAALMGVSAAGLDLSNLAMVVGALSVGIGFGLQNVVNNFVSGIILLVERPIKPGDWVQVNGMEGIVKKVNVRSTELETFQKAAVIIPNGDLLSNAVTNMTHKNMMGRVEVLVGVAYGTDIEKVKAILLECAKRHPQTLIYPQPVVLFQSFGGSSLDFEVRCFIGDVGNKVAVASDIRCSIYGEFAAAGIEIPFQQTVIHFAPGHRPGDASKTLADFVAAEPEKPSAADQKQVEEAKGKSPARARRKTA